MIDIQSPGTGQFAGQQKLTAWQTWLIKGYDPDSSQWQPGDRLNIQMPTYKYSDSQ